MLLGNFLPSSYLQEYVRFFGIVHFSFPGNILIPPKPYSPRPETSLCFIVKDPEYIVYPGSNIEIKHPPVFVYGQHTVINTRLPGREFLALIVHFQPGVLYRLTGIPVNEFTNTWADAELMVPKEIKFVNEQLDECSSYREMIATLEAFLIKLISRSRRSIHGVDAAAKLILQGTEHISIDWLVKETCLCAKQFERKFKERTGVTASTLERIVRFDRTVKMKNACPDKDLLSIAVQCGYHDYQHMVRDYKTFTSLTPTAYFTLDTQAPESVFGLHDVGSMFTI